MRAEKSRPLGKGTGEASTNRKEKRMHTEHTTAELQEAVDRFDDLFDFHYPALRGSQSVAGVECTPEALDAASDLFVDTLPLTVIL